jgi:2'-5' RNA ligase
VRIFLAIEIPQDVKEKLVKIQEKLKQRMPGVRWEKAEKLHITLVFLGEVDENRLGELEKVVEKSIKGMKARLDFAERSDARRGINVGFSGVGVFPNAKRPRVVLLEIDEGREEIERLQKKLAGALSEAGFSFARPSKPHVTLGRFRRGTDATRRVGVDSTLWVENFRAKEIAIVESRLHPKGAIHTPIARIPLEKGV